MPLICSYYNYYYYYYYYVQLLQMIRFSPDYPMISDECLSIHIPLSSSCQLPLLRSFANMATNFAANEIEDYYHDYDDDGAYCCCDYCLLNCQLLNYHFRIYRLHILS